MTVNFIQCTSLTIDNINIVDGQLLYEIDTQRQYMDINNKRLELTSVIVVDSINEVEKPISNKLYYDKTSNTQYIYINDEFKVLSKDEQELIVDIGTISNEIDEIKEDIRNIKQHLGI